MIEKKNSKLSLQKQCELLGISRSGIYYKPKDKKEDLILMREIDEQFMQAPFYGSRRMREVLKRKGYNINRKKVVRLMKKMGIEAIYPKPKTSIKNLLHKKYPYLLRNKKISFPDQAWAADITYIPLARGFGYLVAIIDWHSRYVISWQLSNLLDTEFCLIALDQALSKKVPKIFNTDQGSQFTSNDFTGRLEKSGIQISMDGRGRALDNIFIERLWRSLKYENIYPIGYENFKELKKGLKNYFQFYNDERVHQGLNYQTPAEVYYEKK